MAGPVRTSSNGSRWPSTCPLLERSRRYARELPTTRSTAQSRAPARPRWNNATACEARRLAEGHAGSTAVLYTCDTPVCAEQAQVLTADLAAIKIRITVKRFPLVTLFAKLAKPGEPFDIGTVAWLSNYPDPDAMLNF